MDYQRYKQEYQRHTDLITQFDGLIVTNEQKQHENASELKTAEGRQDALSSESTPPENVDVDALQAADADVQRLRESRLELDEQWSELKTGRDEVFDSREKLEIDNPDLEAQRFSDSVPPPESERGVGMTGKTAAILLTLNASGAEVHNINAENLSSQPPAVVSEHKVVSEYQQGGDALNESVPPQVQSSPQEHSLTEPQNVAAPQEGPHAQPQDQHPEDHKEHSSEKPHPGDEHTHEDHEYEDHRAQTTTLVMPPEPETTASYRVGAEFKPPDSPSDVTVSVVDGEPPQTATPRPPEPADAGTSQTYEVTPGGSFPPPISAPEPAEDLPASPGGGGQHSSQPLGPPKDTEQLLITSDRENQKLLTYQPNQPEHDTRPSGDPPVSQPAPAMPAPSDDIPATSSAPQIAPPSDDIPATEPAAPPPPSNDMAM